MRRTLCISAGLTVALLVGLLVSPAPAAAPSQTGKIVVNAAKWSVTLYPTPRGRSVRLKGGKDPVAVAPGKYRISYVVYAPASGKATPARISGRTKALITVTAGKTTELKIGAPLTAAITTRAKKGSVTLGLGFTDAGGNKVMAYPSPGKSRKPVPPKIKVVDNGGKVVYTATMKFG